MDNREAASSSRSKSRSSNGDKKSRGKDDLDSNDNNIPEIDQSQSSFTRYIAESFLEIEKRKHVEFSRRKYYDDMGSVTEIERNFKSFLAKNLDKATNHGPEINNPNPEGFANGPEDFLPVVLPSAKIGEYVRRRFEERKIVLDIRYYGIEIGKTNLDAATVKLRGEEPLCIFVNIMREIGYNLKIHPKWGWRFEEPKKHNIVTDLDGGKSRRRRTYFRELICGQDRPAYFDWEGFKSEFGKLQIEAFKHGDLDEEMLNRIDFRLNEELKKFDETIGVIKSNRITQERNARLIGQTLQIRMRSLPRLLTIGQIVAELGLQDQEGFLEYISAKYRIMVDGKLFQRWNGLSELLVALGVNYAWGAAFNQSAAKSFPDDAEKIRHLAAGERSLLTKQTMKIGRHISFRFERWRVEQIQEILGDLEMRFELLERVSGESSLVKKFIKEEEIYRDNPKDRDNPKELSDGHSKKVSKSKESSSKSRSRGRG